MPRRLAVTPPPNPTFSRASGLLGAARRYHPGEDHSELEREVRFLGLEQYVRQIVDEAPPLTKAQRAELARILTSRKPVVIDQPANTNDLGGDAA